VVFEKTDDKESLLVLVNVRNEEKKAQIPEKWVGHGAKDKMTDKDVNLEKAMVLSPFQYLILKY
jgi:hypothetical protein